LVATRSTCLRRQVGCVLVNEHRHIVATGYNGVPSGWSHCNEGHPCAGCGSTSGTNLDGCHALHAEWNALLQCRDTLGIRAAYCTTEPCVTCAKLLLNTSCQRIIYAESYTGDGLRLWAQSGREADRL